VYLSPQLSSHTSLSLQDVAPGQAGRVIGLTNTGGTLFSFVGTLLAGAVQAATGSISGVFAFTGVICLTSLAVFWQVSAGGALFPEEDPAR
jgi:nitrate/nitrite transporter NarK